MRAERGLNSSKTKNKDKLSLAAQHVAPRPAALALLGNLLETAAWHYPTHVRNTEAGVTNKPNQNVHFNKISRRLACSFSVEKH